MRFGKSRYHNGLYFEWYTKKKKHRIGLLSLPKNEELLTTIFYTFNRKDKNTFKHHFQIRFLWFAYAFIKESSQ